MVATRLQLVVFVLGILLLCLSYSVFCVLCLYCSGLVVITRQMIGQKDCRDDTSTELRRLKILSFCVLILYLYPALKHVFVTTVFGIIFELQCMNQSYVNMLTFPVCRFADAPLVDM